MSDYKIKKVLKEFFEYQQELLKMDYLKPVWKIWLDSPAAWLTFAQARFNEEEMRKATKIILNAKADVKNMHLHYIASLITSAINNPDNEMLTIRQMYEKFGGMEEEEVLTMAEEYAKSVGYNGLE